MIQFESIDTPNNQAHELQSVGPTDCVNCKIKVMLPSIFRSQDAESQTSSSTNSVEESTLHMGNVFGLNTIQSHEEGNQQSSSEESVPQKQLFDLYPDKAIRMLKRKKQQVSQEDLLKAVETDSEIKKSGDDVLSLPDITLPENQNVPQKQDRNAYSEKDSHSEIDIAETEEDVNAIQDILPFTIEVDPMTLVVDGNECTLSMWNITKKYQGIHYSNYSFHTDEECKNRNEAVDRLIHEREERAKTTEEYKSMVNLTLSDETAIFASDHISLKHTRMIFKELRKKEKMIAQELTSRMANQTCFAPVLNKYIAMRKELDSTRVSIWNEVKAKLQKENAELAAERRISPRFVSQGEVYNAYRSYLTEKRVKQRSLFQDVTFYSSPNEHCDGCRIPAAVKDFKPVLNYPEHFYIRKFVGDKETTDISSDDNRGFFLKRLMNSVVCSAKFSF